MIYLHREPGSGWPITIWISQAMARYHFILAVVFYPNLKAQCGLLAPVRRLVNLQTFPSLTIDPTACKNRSTRL